MNCLADASRGRWPQILSALAGLSAQQLTDKHQPCPLCGGEDRYRFDDLNGDGTWFCNQCGGKHQSGGAGNGMDLLMRKTGWSFADAAKRVEQHLGITPHTPPPSTDPPTKGAEHVWRYSSTFLVTRFPGKKIRPLWWDGSAWRWKAPPAPRPLLNLDQLNAKPDAKVLIVEGEKAADAAARLFPTAVVTTWPSGCKAINKADWSPLSGRHLTLWPDNDDVGNDAMLKLAALLMQTVKPASIKIITNDPELPEGWDIADADWTSNQATEYVIAHIEEITDRVQQLQPIDDDPLPINTQPDDPPPIKPSPGGYFTCLGFDHDAFYYQPHRTGQVVRLSRSSHTGTNLVALAPLGYWEALYPGKSGPNWTAAASDLFEQQGTIGIYSPDRIRGRGAWWDGGRSVLHLGDRLVVDGADRSITDRLTGSTYLYQRLSSLQGPADASPLTDSESYMLAEIAERFHWEVPASGLLLAGWVTLAPICGALPWRPHAWLTAAAGSGKSAILDRYVTPLLGDMGLIVAGNTTEPGIRQALRADALPVVFDEAESNERNDQQRMQAILGLARVASSESKAHTIKGTPEGDTQRFTIRSMFLMSSIATSLKQGADKSRFAQLTLRNPSELPKDQRQAHWDALDRDLDRFISEDIGRRLQARTISLIPTIRASIRIFTRVAAEHFDSQRLGDQYGTLLAGAWSLHSPEIVTVEQAQRLIDDNDWAPYSQATEIPDERRCIQCILQHQVRVEADERICTRTMGELVEIATSHRMDREVEPRQAMDALIRHGLKVEPDEQRLVVSNTAEALAAILRDTAWSHSWATVLSRLPGATKTGAVRFGGAGTVSRGTALQIADL